jgi:hypothetical protein
MHGLTTLSHRRCEHRSRTAQSIGRVALRRKRAHAARNEDLYQLASLFCTSLAGRTSPGTSFSGSGLRLGAS